MTQLLFGSVLENDYGPPLPEPSAAAKLDILCTFLYEWGGGSKNLTQRNCIFFWGGGLRDSRDMPPCPHVFVIS